MAGRFRAGGRTYYPYRLPRKYRYRRNGKVTGRQAAAGLAVAVIAAGVAAHPAPAKSTVRHAAAGMPATATAVTVANGTGLDTPAGWAKALLVAEGDPQTACDFSAVAEWERREGGGFGNQAAYNPLNVNPGPGAGWPGYPVIGAWAFPDAATGLHYTIATLDNGDYGPILAALRAGNNAQAVCDAIMASPWAASHYDGTLTASC